MAKIERLIFNFNQEQGNDEKCISQSRHEVELEHRRGGVFVIDRLFEEKRNRRVNAKGEHPKFGLGHDGESGASLGRSLCGS
jgi:hypothetical protein